MTEPAALTWIIIPLLMIAVLVFARLRSGPLYGPDHRIRLDQIPAVYESLRKSGTEGSFAQFSPLPAPDTEELCIQFSIENGRPGLDWVLLSDENLRDRGAFETFLELIPGGTGSLEKGLERFAVAKILVAQENPIQARATVLDGELYAQFLGIRCW